MKPLIYLDNSATTKIHDEVVNAMMPFLTNQWGNASSLHSMGRTAQAAMEQAREQVASFLGAEPSEIIFTPNATYSNNLVLFGRARFVEENGLGKHLITSRIEHPATIESVKYLKSKGWRVTGLPVNHEGFIDLDELKAAITDDTSIISIMWANNEVGSIQPVREVAGIAADRGIFFHTDAVQAAGKNKISVSAPGIQSLSLSGHKFHAPKGIGILYLKNGVEILPYGFGGGQERGLAPGTENVALIVAIGKAAEIAERELESNVGHLNKLSDILCNKLLSLPQVKLTGTSNREKRVPGHLSVVVVGQTGKDILQEANQEGVCISSTSACASGKSKPSHVLRALGLSDEQTQGALRITASSLNTEEECANASDILARIITNNSLEPTAVAQSKQPLPSLLR